jgi:ATP-binding protein involved in chromosome partitioning
MKVMSVDLLVRDDREPVMWNAPTQKDAYTWRAMMEMGAIREFLADTEWGTLDYLFIDLPPGTDKLPNIVGLLPRISGTVIVTIPSAVSQFVVGKSIRVARERLKTPIIGLVENMSSYTCPHCGENDDLFPAGRIQQMASDEGIPYLGMIPFDPKIALSADNESLFVTAYRDSPAALSIHRIAGAIDGFVGGQS